MEQFKNKKILLVDDESILLEILQYNFLELGMQVETATNGQEAFVKLQASPASYDFLLTDIRMPIENGITLLRNINIKAEEFPHLKIFVCSGFHDLTEVEAKTLRVLHIFSKPFDLEELNETMVKFF